MTRKRFKKLMMSIGYSRNAANTIADLISAATLTCGKMSAKPTYAVSWIGFQYVQKLRQDFEERRGEDGKSTAASE